MIEPERDKTKDYKIQQLEKLVDEQRYYMSNSKNISKFIDESSHILNDLKKHKLTEDEVLKVSKMTIWIEKLRLTRLLR